MDYSLIEKNTSDNLLIKGYDLMYMGETKAETKKIFENRLKTQENKLKEAGFNYWDVIYKLRYTK